MMSNGEIFACLMVFDAGLFFGLGALLIFLTARLEYRRGEEDATPLRAKNGQFIGRAE